MSESGVTVCPHRASVLFPEHSPHGHPQSWRPERHHPAPPPKLLMLGTRVWTLQEGEGADVCLSSELETPLSWICSCQEMPEHRPVTRTTYGHLSAKRPGPLSPLLWEQGFWLGRSQLGDQAKAMVSGLGLWTVIVRMVCRRGLWGWSMVMVCNLWSVVPVRFMWP